MAVVFLISDIILAYFWIVRGNSMKEKPLNKLEKLAFVVVFAIFMIDAGIGITTTLSKEISDKKAYEIIENKKAIITDYEGKFLIMDCELQENVLYISKGKYSLIDMSNVDIEYREFDQVICI